MTLPSGACIERVQVPPGRTSMRPESPVKPRGPHQRARCSGSVHILKRSMRGASKIRVTTSSCSAERSAASAVMAIRPLPALKFAKIRVETIKAVVPEMAVVLEPLGGVLEWPRLEPAGPPLRSAAARDQPGALQHLQMLGDGGKAHRKGLGELADSGLARGETRQDRATCRIGKGRVGGAEVIGQHAAETV